MRIHHNAEKVGYNTNFVAANTETLRAQTVR